jgi:hypothetical protein
MRGDVRECRFDVTVPLMSGTHSFPSPVRMIILQGHQEPDRTRYSRAERLATSFASHSTAWASIIAAMPMVVQNLNVIDTPMALVGPNLCSLHLSRVRFGWATSVTSSITVPMRSDD